jgi:hypothetical protein
MVVLLWSPSRSIAAVTVDASQTFQSIDGFGVNANHRAWNNDELKPVLDQLVDNAGMTLFRLVYDNADWETNNDNADPTLMNWAYYSLAYTNQDFQKMWSIMAYLNQKGITNGLIPNFQGFGPAWMAYPYPNYRSLASGKESEWAEMIASALVWARYTNHLQFTQVGPNNEPDIPGSGFGISNGVQYAITLHALSQQLDSNGLSDVRFVGPDLAVTTGGTNWLPDLLSDSTVMSKLGHYGTHSYGCCGSHSELLSNFVAHSAYPNRTFWMTEFNVDCYSCQYASAGTNSWGYARAQAEYLLSYLSFGASAAFVWDACDSPYLNNSDDGIHWTFWGLFAVSTTNNVPKTYTPRKGFYTLSQITKYVKPGALRIAVSGVSSPIQVLAFYHRDRHELAITGVNSSSNTTTLSATLLSLAGITNLNLTYTTTSDNLRDGGSVPVSNGTFSVAVPGDSVFTLVGHVPPVIMGRVTDTNGQAVAGVSLQPNGGLQSVTSDGAGNYSLGVPWGWAGTVTPAVGNLMFIPGFRGYSNLVASVTNQDYVELPTIAATLQIAQTDTNVACSWYAYSGVVYQVLASSNLVDWTPWGGGIPGTNGMLQFAYPPTQPKQFFRIISQD